MQEEKSTRSSANESVKIMICGMGQNGNSSKIKLDNIKKQQISKLCFIVIGIIFLIISTYYILNSLLLIVPPYVVQDAMLIYNNNSTKAGMHINVANNLLLSTITVVYVILTWALVTESKKAIAQTKKEQQIRDIENRLEKFYIPADEIINNPQTNKNRDNTLTGHPGSLSKDPQYVIGIKHLRKYSYLADTKTFKAYETYINSNCTNLKSITCQDRYGNFTFCEHQKNLCYSRWDICPYNLE